METIAYLLDDDCDGLVDNAPECYPDVPDTWYEPQPEEEMQDEFEWARFEKEVEEAIKQDRVEREQAEDPAEPVDALAGGFITFDNDTEPEQEILVEVVPASGCESSRSKKTVVGFIVLLLLVYGFGLFMGHNVRRNSKKNKDLHR